MFGRSVSLNAIDIYTTQPKNGNTIGHFHLLHPPKTDKTVVLLSTMHNKEDVNTDSEKKKPLMILDYSATKGAVDTFDMKVNWSSPTRAQGQPDDDQ